MTNAFYGPLQPESVTDKDGNELFCAENLAD